MTQAESDIIIRCQGGDKDAFRWVVNTYQQMVFSLALKMLCDEDKEKDIVTMIHSVHSPHGSTLSPHGSVWTG